MHRKTMGLCALLCALSWAPFAQPAFAAEPLRILLTNDDGVDSPGIQALRSAFAAAGHRVTVVAPAANVSGSSAMVTLAAVPVEQREADVYAVEGSPATTVLLGISALFDAATPPDLVVSGINNGANLGPATPISGTVGATIAAIQGLEPPIPAIAVSTNLLVDSETPNSAANTTHFANVAAFTARLIERLQDAPGSQNLLPPGIALNVNYPPLAPEAIAGVRTAVQGQASFFRIGYVEAAPGIFAPSFEPIEPENDVPRSDTTLFNQGYITVVPIDGDYTALLRRRQILGSLSGLDP